MGMFCRIVRTSRTPGLLIDSMAPFRVGIDSYCLNPLRMDPFSILDWVAEQGGEGVQFSELHLPPGRSSDAGLLRELGQAARASGMYLEWGGGQHVPFDTRTWEPKDLLPGNRRAAEEAHALGTTVVRSCSGGFFRWNDAAPPTEELLRAMAKTLRPQRSLFEDLGVTLAIELHFEFTTFELLRTLEMCEAPPGGWLGICLDTFNMLPMLEDPVLGTERVLPWVVATHVKDGGLIFAEDGLHSFPTGAGEGLIDLKAVLRSLMTLDSPINLSLEDHGGTFVSPILDERFLTRFPDLTAREVVRLLASAKEGERLMRAGRLEATERDAWPGLCQRRTRAGLANLRALVLELEREPT
jgi:sugar phosphate isomerase/epimerase